MIGRGFVHTLWVFIIALYVADCCVLWQVKCYLDKICESIEGTEKKLDSLEDRVNKIYRSGR